jgi:hypothetical protein
MNRFTGVLTAATLALAVATPAHAAARPDLRVSAVSAGTISGRTVALKLTVANGGRAGASPVAGAGHPLARRQARPG